VLVLGGACASPENDGQGLAESEQALTCPASATDVNAARDLLITVVAHLHSTA
jgi:hypothetical protein